MERHFSTFKHSISSKFLQVSYILYIVLFGQYRTIQYYSYTQETYVNVTIRK